MSQYQHILNALECADQHDYETAQSAALAIRALEQEMAEARDALKAIWPYINNHDGRYWADREYQAAIDKVKAQVNK
jgi:hypothetical protein